MKLKSITLTAASLVASAVASNAALTALNSNAFANQYDGNQIFDGTNTLNGWAANGGASNANLSLSGSNLVLALTNNNGWIEHDNGSTPWEGGTGSWTVEVRANVNAATNSGFVIWGALNGERNIMTILQNSVNEHGGTQHDSNSNVGGFHDFRLAYDAADDVYHYFRDGVQLTPLAGIGQQDGTGNTRLIIGDCCTSSAGSTLGGPGTSVEFEYIRYDNTGAFSPAPIPEPTAAILLGAAGLGCLLRRRR